MKLLMSILLVTAFSSPLAFAQQGGDIANSKTSLRSTAATKIYGENTKPSCSKLPKMTRNAASSGEEHTSLQSNTPTDRNGQAR